MGSEGAPKVILLEPNPFRAITKELKNFKPNWEQTKQCLNVVGDAAICPQRDANPRLNNPVSRPLAGISVKPDTHAYVQVIGSDGSVHKVFNQLGKLPANPMGGLAAGLSALSSAVQGFGFDSDSATNFVDAITAGTKPGFSQSSGNPESSSWTDWVLQSVREERLEKTQLVETFGESYLYTFGEKPRSLIFEGFLYNTEDLNWRAVFWENWERFFRATRLVEADAKMYIGFDDIIVAGYPINAKAGQSAMDPNGVPFSFAFYVTDYINIAANNNFMSMREKVISTVTGGFLNSSYYDGGKLTPDRLSFVDFIGTSGADKLASTTVDGILSLWTGGHPENATRTQRELAILAGQNVGYLADQVQKGALRALSGGISYQNWLRAFTRQTILRAGQLAARTGVAALESQLNLKSGEVNAWFGWMGYLLEKSANSDHDWARSIAGESDTNLLMLGSVERIVQALAYRAAPSQISSTTDPRLQDTRGVIDGAKYSLGTKTPQASCATTTSILFGSGTAQTSAFTATDVLFGSDTAQTSAFTATGALFGSDTAQTSAFTTTDVDSGVTIFRAAPQEDL